MPRKKTDPVTDAALPETFEEFSAAVENAEAKTAAVADRTPIPMGGMVEKAWSGIPMWECPRCKSTTFDAAEAKVHTCPMVRYADEKRDN